ncbi:hypothetical protein LPB140_03830 [Sphingorhabdus lutea]|uniref:Uncharacterized protein n=1 Tax=Sphingorhabdus lutea TaxID=1913578 RepID=A0A1L3JAC7_9SPHN|nr:hypothetical protein LPB140_03830 [Sphingorhabdus lutea]
MQAQANNLFIKKSPSCPKDTIKNAMNGLSLLTSMFIQRQLYGIVILIKSGLKYPNGPINTGLNL